MRVIFEIYLLRIVRLLPIILFTMIMWQSTIFFVNEGVTWHEVGRLFDTCDEYWWAPLVFMSDMMPWYVREWRGCMRWTAIHSIDMKLFILLPILVQMYHKGLKRLAIMICLILVLIGLGINAFMVKYYEMNVGVMNIMDYHSVDHFMYKPYTHIDPYYCGILIAFFFEEFKNLKYVEKS